MVGLNKNTVSSSLLVFNFILIVSLRPVYALIDNKCKLVKEGSSHCIVQAGQTLRCIKTYFNPHQYGYSSAAKRSKEGFQLARNTFADLRSSGICSLGAAAKCEFTKERTQHCIKQEGKNIRCIQTYFNPHQYGHSAAAQKSKEGFNDANRLFADLRNDGVCNFSPGEKCELKKEGSSHCINQGGQNIRCIQTYFNPFQYGHSEATKKNKEEFNVMKNIFINLRSSGVCSFSPGEKCELKKEGSNHCIKQDGKDIHCIQTYFNPHRYKSADKKGQKGFREISRLFGELGSAGICKSQQREAICDIRLDENSNQYILSEQSHRSYLNSSEELYNPVGTFPSEQYEDERHPNLESAVRALQSKVHLGKCTPRNPGDNFCKIRQLPSGSIVLSRGGEIIDGSCSGAAELNRKRRLLGQVGLCAPFIYNTENSNSNPITESHISGGRVNHIPLEEVEFSGSAEEK